MERRVSVHEEGGGGHRFEIHADAAWDHLDAADPGDAGLVYFGTLAQRHDASRAAVRATVKRARGVKLLDLNLRPGTDTPELAAESLMLADWVKLNEDELARLLAWFEPDLAALMARFHAALEPGDDVVVGQQLGRLARPRRPCGGRAAGPTAAGPRSARRRRPGPGRDGPCASAAARAQGPRPRRCPRRAARAHPPTARRPGPCRRRRPPVAPRRGGRCRRPAAAHSSRSSAPRRRPWRGPPRRWPRAATRPAAAPSPPAPAAARRREETAMSVGARARRKGLPEVVQWSQCHCLPARTRLSWFPCETEATPGKRMHLRGRGWRRRNRTAHGRGGRCGWRSAAPEREKEKAGRGGAATGERGRGLKLENGI